MQQHNEVQHLEELITAALHTETVTYILSMTKSHCLSINNEPTPAVLTVRHQSLLMISVQCRSVAQERQMHRSLILRLS